MSEEESCRLMLGKICMWVEDFAKDPDDTTYLCVLRLLADYRRLQMQEVEEAIEKLENQKNEPDTV
jgi:hypothetical protein